MRVLDVHFPVDTPSGPLGTRSTMKRTFSAPEHVMEWLPSEGVLLIDGWRHSPVGARWRVDDGMFSGIDRTTAPLPTDDTSMFKVYSGAEKILLDEEPRVFRRGGLIGTAEQHEANDKAVRGWLAAPIPELNDLEFSAGDTDTRATPKEPDGPDQPSGPGGPARGKKRSRKV